MFRPVLIFLLILLSACSQHIADISMISTRDININELDLDRLPKTRAVVAEDVKYNFIIPILRPRLEDAVERALIKADGDLLIDATVNWDWWWFIIGRSAIRVEGTVVNTKAHNTIGEF